MSARAAIWAGRNRFLYMSGMPAGRAYQRVFKIADPDSADSLAATLGHGVVHAQLALGGGLQRGERDRGHVALIDVQPERQSRSRPPPQCRGSCTAGRLDLDCAVAVEAAVQEADRVQLQARVRVRCRAHWHARWPGAVEAWAGCCAGRRSGKSRVLALVAVYLACFASWKSRLAAGKTGVVMCLAADRDQASVLLAYCRGLINGIRCWRGWMTADGVDRIELGTKRVAIEVHTSSSSTSE